MTPPVTFGGIAKDVFLVGRGWWESLEN